MLRDDQIAAVRLCIRRFALARSGRGVWQVERDLAVKLGGSAIDIATAAAARRIGEWLREQPSNGPRGA